MGTTALLVLLLMQPAPATSRVEELTRELIVARQEIEELKKKSNYYVYCDRADLSRSTPGGDDRTIAGVLARLAPLGVDPIYATHDVALQNAPPRGYLVRAGCSFLGGDEITEVNGIPLADRARAQDELKYTQEWRFTVSKRSFKSRKEAPRGDARAFDLATALGLRSGSEAMLFPAFVADQPHGFLARSVVQGGLLARAGLREGDLVVSLNGQSLQPDSASQQIQREWKQTGRLAFEVERSGQRVYLTTLADPDHAP
jgi:S1-C subfamily serine protease